MSDGDEPLFGEDSEHQHDQTCSMCESLKKITSDIQECLNRTDVSLAEDTLDDFRFSTHQAVQNIEAWKAHQLRSARQDAARTDVLELLDESSVMMTMDWAMKFLPQKYRESQTDWFAKRGISWHIAVTVRKSNGNLQSQSFVHILDNCTQDSALVIRIIIHVLEILKREHPEISRAFLRSDNAGCYHSSVTLSACRFMEERTGIAVARVVFSDPQGGKGPCDRKAATVKAHVRRWINEGHDIQTARDFYQAMNSLGGVKGVRVVHEDAAELKEQQVKWEGVSFLNNFEYTGQSIKVWRAYNIGHGKTVGAQLPSLGKQSVQACSVVSRRGSGGGASYDVQIMAIPRKKGLN